LFVLKPAKGGMARKRRDLAVNILNDGPRAAAIGVVIRMTIEAKH
jgi:hypothetical protein